MLNCGVAAVLDRVHRTSHRHKAQIEGSTSGPEVQANAIAAAGLKKCRPPVIRRT